MALVEGRLTETGEIEAPIGNLKHERAGQRDARGTGCADTLSSACITWDEGRYYTLLEVVPRVGALTSSPRAPGVVWVSRRGDKLYGSQRQRIG